MQTRHLNGRRADNRLSNLQWATPKRNHQDRLRHGTLSPKLSVDDAMTIRAAYGYAPAYPEPVIAMLAKRYGVTPATIRDIVTRRRWKMDESAILRRELRRDPAVRRHARQAVAKLAEQDCPEDVDRVLADFDELAGPVPSIH
jgi:adenylate kinase